jgi:hypothetical protein
LCAFQSLRWHSREQYRTASHRPHMLLASSDAHPAAAHPAFATHSAFSDSSFPSSSATAYRPVRASLAVVLGLGDEPLHEHASAGGQRTRRAGPAAAGAAVLVGGVARMRARTCSKSLAPPSV